MEYTNAHERVHLVLSHSATHVWTTTYRGGGNMSYKYVNRVTSTFVSVCVYVDDTTIT